MTQPHTIDDEPVPEVRVTLQRAKKKLDAFMFSDSDPAMPDESKSTADESSKPGQEERAGASKTADDTAEDLPSAALSEIDLF